MDRRVQARALVDEVVFDLCHVRARQEQADEKILDKLFSLAGQEI